MRLESFCQPTQVQDEVVLATQVITYVSQCVMEHTEAHDIQLPTEGGAEQPRDDVGRPMAAVDVDHEHAGDAAAVEGHGDQRYHHPGLEEGTGPDRGTAAETAEQPPISGASGPGADLVAEPERSDAAAAVDTAVAPPTAEVTSPSEAEQAPEPANPPEHDVVAVPLREASTAGSPDCSAAPAAQHPALDRREVSGPVEVDVTACTPPTGPRLAPRICGGLPAGACAAGCTASLAAEEALFMSEAAATASLQGGSASIRNTCGAWDRDIARVWVEVCDNMQAGCEESTLRQRVLHGDADCAARQCGLRLVARPQVQFNGGFQLSGSNAV